MSQSPRRPVKENSPTRNRSSDSPKSRSKHRRSSSARSSHSGEQRENYKSRTSVSPKSPSGENSKRRSSRRSVSSKNSSRDDCNKRRRSRSPSYSRDKKRTKHDGDRRSRSRSPIPSRRRPQGNRKDPEPGTCLGIFGLSLHTSKNKLQDLFSKYGPITDLQLIIDGQTGRSRGFGFITFEYTADATEAREQCTYRGLELDGREVRVDYSITKRAHTPTPGMYMGEPTSSGGYGRRGGSGGGRRYGGYSGARHGGYSGGRTGRSPSPYQREDRGPPRSSHRSRSRS